MSIMTGMTDMSTDTAVVAHAERVTMAVGSLVSPREDDEDQEFGLLKAEDRFKFDFGSKFDLGDLGMTQRNDDAMDAEDEVEVTSPTTTGMRMGDHDVDMEMKSALDRLMEDVAGGRVDDSMMTDDSFISQDSQLTEASLPERITSRPMVLERAATDTAFLHSVPHIPSRSVSGSSTLSTISSMGPPPVPPKDNIKAREEMILRKRREARGIMSDDSGDEGFKPQKNQRHLSVGRPSHRRSMSTGDVEDPTGRGRSLLELAESQTDNLLGNIEQELVRMSEEPNTRKSVSLVLFSAHKLSVNPRATFRDTMFESTRILFMHHLRMRRSPICLVLGTLTLAVLGDQCADPLIWYAVFLTLPHNLTTDISYRMSTRSRSGNIAPKIKGKRMEKFS
jgi:hypothetical protein